ncbi:transglycosylase [Siculibacillus lacustris]|uniref:peptidoglycan lytic exotransglycosylase n=1 Tax=Siculibacillus lacustris TaxID=1549641 RepID=A0A4V2KT57_9HYPH|nr:MltA domain-containing protein [Siculibacillus lacustris]TBW35792.1 transglycosylase [Siculibacillus lacustris]
MSEPSADLRRLSFADLPGWGEAALEASLVALRRHARAADAPPPATGALGVDGVALAAVARAAADLPAGYDRAAARAFFEARFVPFAVEPRDPPAFLTGYFEPDLPGSRQPSARFRVPLLAPPDDLVAIDPAAPPPGLAPGFAFARSTRHGLEPCPDRPAIADGALAARGLELVWLEDPVDAYFVHVQGSARIRLAEGGELRLAYAAKSGHPYTSIGRLAVARGLIAAEAMTAETLRAWLKAHPDAAEALMRENRSFVFFRQQSGLDPSLGALGAAGVPLTPGFSLAVDHRLHTWGTPIFVAADLPLDADGPEQPFARLMIADDTGSAIVGAARGDVFVGLGADAGVIAGRLRHAPRCFVVLAPRDPATGGAR